MRTSTNRQAASPMQLFIVERTDGPVTLARVDREVAGFAKDEPPNWPQETCFLVPAGSQLR